MSLRTWVLAARPKTLSAAVVPVLMASALATHEPPGMSWWIFWCALGVGVLIQIATNFINDALDFKRGADTHERVGPVRVTQAGLASYGTVMTAAALCLIGAALCGIPLINRGGWPMLVVGLASMAGAYLYTGGPYPLAYHGLGEIFVIIFFGLVATATTFYLHALQLQPSSLVAGLAAGSLATVLLAINNLRDREGDERSNKRTMAVRFGERFAHAEIAFFALLPFVCAAIVAWQRDRMWLMLPIAALPLAAVLIRRVVRSRGAELNRCLALAGVLQWTFGLLFVAGTLV